MSATRSSAQDHRQPGAAEIQNIRDFTPLLRAHPWLLWFEDQQDEDGYTAHMWEKLWQRQVVSTSLHFVFIVLVAALALAPLDVYDDTNTLLMFLLGQLVPTAVMIAWAVTPWWRLQARYWPVVAAVCVTIVAAAQHASVHHCAITKEAPADLVDLPGCAALAAKQMPWLSFALVMVLPYMLVFGLHVRWFIMVIAQVANLVVFVALVLVHVDGKMVMSVVAAVLNTTSVVFIAWYQQAEQYAVFKTRLAHRRMLADVVNERRNRYTAQEVGSRIFELIKRSDHMLAEYDENNVFKFVSPSCKQLLGYPEQELTNKDMMQLVHPGDRTVLKRELANLRSGHTKHVKCCFRRLARSGVVWVEMHAHVVKRRGFDAAVLGMEHKLPDQSTRQVASAKSLPAVEAPANPQATSTSSEPLAIAVLGTVHESRHPITAAKCATKALRKMLAAHKEAAVAAVDQLDTLADSVDQIRRLMQDIFVAYNGSPMVVTVLPQPFKLLHLLQRICKQFQFLTSVHIKVEISAGVPKDVRVDKQRLMQLLSNAVTNAATASRSSDGRIVVNVSKNASKPFLRYEIKDNGQNPPKHPEQVFASKVPTFTMSQPPQMWGGSTAASLVPAGGMGLANCKRLVAAMRGTIGLERENDTTTLWFELPVSVEAIKTVEGRGAENVGANGAAPAPAAGGGAGAGAGARESKSSAPSRRRPRKPRQANPATQGLKVLLVDDERVNRRLGARMLERLGCKHVLLEDGDQVPGKLAEEQNLDVILMDIMMKRSDGAVVCKQLRDSGCVLPIIAMTGATGVRDVERFMKAGFDLVLPKPFDMKAMGRALSEARARRAGTATAATTATESTQPPPAPAPAPAPAGSAPSAPATPVAAAPAPAPAAAAETKAEAKATE